MAFSSRSYIMHSVRTTHVFQNKAAQHVYVQDTCNTDALEIRFKNKSYFISFRYFLNILLEFVVHAFTSLFNLDC